MLAFQSNAAIIFNWNSSVFSFTYDGSSFNYPTPQVGGATPGVPSTLDYYIKGINSTSFNSSLIANNIPIAAGDYEVYVIFTQSGSSTQSITKQFTINKAPLTISAINANKIYGTTQGTLIGSTEFNSTGLQNGETIGSVTLNFGIGATAASDPVGSTSVITPSAATGGTFTSSNYTINYVNGTLTVVPAILTITANNTSKIYGVTQSTPVTGSTLFSSTGLQNGETIGSVTLNFGIGASASTDPVGNTSVIIPSSPVDGTFNVNNYTINYVNGTLTVNASTLTVTASNQSKSYGATAPLTGTLNTNYSVAGLKNTDAVSGVVLSYNGSPTGNLSTASVGTYSITASGLTLSSGSLSNYTINYVNGTLTVNASTLTVTASNQSKSYGATAPLTGTLNTNYSVDGLKNTDAVSGVELSYNGSPTGNLSSALVGTYSITASGLTLSSGSLSNYTIGYVSGTLSVIKAFLTVNVTANDKVYDGNTTATATLTDNRIAGDDITANKTGATFNNKNIGTGKAVTVSGITLTGTDAGNYSLTSSTATGTASITVRSLTVSATASDKVYDGNTTATATLTDNRIAGDDFTVNKTGATFNNKNIGTGKAVTVSGITLTGTDAGNYTLTSATATGTASITVRSLTVSATASDKVYDGNTTATATLTDSRISGDDLMVNKTGVIFNNKNIGTSKAVIISGITLTGTDAGNYTLTSATATGTASITVKSLTVSAIASDKVYDGNTTATATLTDNRIAGDVFTMNKIATFNNKNIGTGKTIAVSDITLTGTDAGNYTLTSATTAGTATITIRSLTISATASDKIYDGNTAATATLTDNRISGDDLTVNKTGATFNNKNIGTGKTVTVSGITLNGTDAGNYTLTSATATGTASITVRSLTVSTTASDKVYDGNTTATATLTDNKISGDDLMVIKTGATFNNKNAGPAKAVSVIGITLTGTDAGNYTLTSATATGTASITVKSLTITATASDKVYDGNTTATAILSDNRISGDVLTINKTGATFNNKNVASGKTFTVSGISLAGVDAVNYNIISSTATGTASITPKNLTVSAIAKNKPYDGNRKAEVTLTENKISGDNITTSYILAEFDNPEVGDNKLVTVSGISIGGVDVGNYNLTSNNVTTNASITAPATIIFEIPNAFTPNGDGMNDELKIISNAGVRSLTSFKIFSRSGNLVFESRDLSRGWDGRYNGNLLPADIYYWTALYVDRNNVTNPKNGTVLLLK